MSDLTQIPLASAIRALRIDLQEAVRASDGEDLRFALGPIELELEVQAGCEGSVETGIKFWLVSVGAKGARSSGATHRVRLSLTPVRVGAFAADGEHDVLVASELEERG